MQQSSVSLSEPSSKPKSPCFSCGPTNKYPGWSDLTTVPLFMGRSHRAPGAMDQIKRVYHLTREVLEVPDDYYIAILPGSATGAVEASLWNLLGPQPVDVFAWDVFSRLWVLDVVKQLKLPKHNVYEEDWGKLPDLTKYNPDHDLVFTWNGTTAGVCIPNGDWIPSNRKGLSICDATSAAFIFPVRDWSKIDAYAFSWQKGLGGEGAHGMLVLSPRAVDRLTSYVPQWPIPRLLRITRDHKLTPGLFNEGKIINTPSMFALHDAEKALNWAKSLGGQEGLWKKTQDNFAAMNAWISNHTELSYLPQDPSIVSPVSVCLELKGSVADVTQRIKFVVDELTGRGIAYDFKNHALAPLSFRIWCGPTVDRGDLESLFEWIDWALERSKVIKTV